MALRGCMNPTIRISLYYSCPSIMRSSKSEPEALWIMAPFSDRLFTISSNRWILPWFSIMASSSENLTWWITSSYFHSPPNKAVRNRFLESRKYFLFTHSFTPSATPRDNWASGKDVQGVLQNTQLADEPFVQRYNIAEDSRLLYSKLLQSIPD